MNNIQHLYKALIESNLLNISFDKFSQFYENDKYKQNVFSAVKEKGLFDGDFERFSSMYSLPKAKPGVDKDGNDIMIGGEVSQEKNTWLENAFGKNTVTDFVGDLYRSGKQGWAAGQSVDEALEVYKKGRNLSTEDLQAFLDANKRMQEAGVTDEMLNYQKMYEENGGGMWGAVKAFAANPTIAPAVIVSSVAQMISSAEDSEEVLGMAALSSGAGAAAGAAIGSTGFSLGPLGALTTAGGAVSGAVGGFFGGLTGAMETGNTLAQLLQEEIGEGVEMTKENVRAILENADKFQDLKDKAVARGLTIGAIEGVTAGISRGIGGVAVKGATTIGKGGKKVQKALTATQKGRLAKQVAALEMTAGAGGEALGQKAAGQELDASEIFLEGIAEAKGVANVADILAKRSYTLNGGAATRKDIESFLNNENVSNEDKAKAKIEVIGDKSLKAFVDQTQGKAIADSQIDSKITDQADREALVELEQKRVDLNKKAEKKGIEKVPNAAEQLATVEAEIEAIIGKYEGAVEIGKSEGAQKVKRARLDILKDEMTGRVKKMKAYKDMDIDTFEGSIDEIVEQYTNNLVENANYDIQVLEAELKGYQEKGDTKAIKEVQEIIADRQETLEDAAKGLTRDEKGKKIKISETVNAGTYGMLLEDNTTGKLTMVLSNEADITDEGGYVNVAAHEFLHAALRKTFFKKSDVVAGMTEARGAGIQTGQKLINHLLESGEVDFLNQIKSRLKAYGAVDKAGKINLTEDLQAQEVLNLLSDSMVNEIYKAENEGFFVKLGSIISEQLQSLLPDSYAKKLQFKDGKQVFDFVKTFGKAVAGDKAAGKIIARAAREGVDVGPIKGKEGARVTAQKSSVIQEKVDGFALNEDGSKMTKQEYDAKGSVDAYTYLIGDQNLDPLINKQLVKAGIDINAVDANVNGVPLEEFQERVRELLIPDILGFDPGKETTKDGKFGLSGHVNSRIAFRVGDAAKKAKKQVATSSLDKDVSGDGKMTAADFIADEQDAMIEDFENRDQSIFADPVEERGVVKSEYRQKLKRKDGKKFIAEQQEEDIRQGVRDVVKSQKTEISEKDFMLKFENNVKKKMKNIVQQAMGSGKSFIDFVYDNIDVILEYSTIQDLVAMERLVGQKFPEGKRIFSVIVKKNISPTEVDNAINKGKIKPDVGRNTGPDLYEKRKPTKAEVEAFFLGRTSDGQTMADVLNYEIGRSTRGTRKDGLSRMMISTLALDAVMETIQEPGVIEEASVFSPSINKEVQLQELAIKVNRGINTQFSRAGETQVIELTDLLAINGQNSSPVLNYIKQNKVSKEVENEALRRFGGRGHDHQGDLNKLPGFKESLKESKVGREPRHKSLERLVLNNLQIGVESIVSKTKQAIMMMADPMEGFMPDAMLMFQQGVKNILASFEVKADIARGVAKSFWFSSKDPNGKNLKTRKAFAEQRDMDTFLGLYKKAFVEIKKIPKLLGLDSIDGDTIISPVQWQKIKDSKIAAAISGITIEIDSDWISRAYAAKDIVTHYINVGAAGLFHLGDAKNDILNLGTESFDGVKIILNIRLVWSGSMGTKPGTKNYGKPKGGTIRLKVYPEINSKDFGKSKVGNLVDSDDAEVIMQKANLKPQLSKSRAKNQNTINNAYNKARLINSDTEAKGISIFDFDETVGVSENFVIATKGKETKRIASDEWPFVGDVLASEGWNFDFTDFNKVTKGKPGPLMQKLKNQIKKYGAKDVYILTARAPESQKAIHDWLKTQGINLPYKNITGLGNSTGEAKAMWILDKYANEGYNDIYFVDDAMPNVEAVKYVLDQLDAKGKSVRAVPNIIKQKVQFSKSSLKNTISSAQYKKFKNSIKDRVLYHGGSETINTIRDNNAVWFYLDDADAAQMWGDGEVYSVKASDIQDMVIIPDLNDVSTFTKHIQEKFNLGDKAYDVRDIMSHPKADEIIKEWIEWSAKNDMTYDIGYNLYEKGNVTNGAAVTVLGAIPKGKIQQVSPQFSKRSMRGDKAVKHIMDQLDVKSKSVQARIQFSKGLGKKFNGIIEQNKGVDADKIFSDVSARKFGKRNNPFRFFVPPSADDFLGLLRYFVGKGKVGEAQMEFFKKALIDPFARAYKEMNSAKMAILNDYKELMKQFPDVKKKLGKLIPGSEFTYDNAVRVYLFNKAGHDIPGLSDKEVAELSEVVTSDPELLAFAETLSAISRVKEGYAKPSDTWSVENVAMDMQNAVDKIGRAKYLEEWQANVDEMFSNENMNKIEAVYGNDVREALGDMLYAMKTGRNRPQKSTKISNAFMNWINNSVGAIMFFNARSAVLQLISIVNFTNFEENNIFAQAKMFANQKQFWSDFSFIFNSDYLKARRSGLKMNINEAELQNAVAGATNKALAALRYILSLGFTPTQIADSVAIAFGGTNFYRSKVKKYLAEGMSQKEAQEKAFLDFQEIAEESQQSSRPDKISQQQRSVIGRIILNFANTPMQMARLTKKAAQDLIAGRGDWKANVSRILYYGFVQNLIFSALQQAIFAIGFDDEEDDEKKKKKQETKIERIFNGALDSLLRGSGIYGAVVATVKNTAYKFIEERGKGFKGDLGNVLVEALNLSPSIGSKFRKLYSAMKNDKFNKHVYDRMGYDTLENPVYQSITLGVEGVTNIPINRMLRKIDNLKASTDSELHALQRIFVFLGWDQWSLGIDSREEVDKVKDEIKQEKKDAKKEVVKKDRKQKKEEAENQYELDQKKERKDGRKNITCSGAKSDGTRCTRKPIKNGKCTIHEKVEMLDDKYKDRQCKRLKSDGSRCKMMTRSKSQFCYYHD